MGLREDFLDALIGGHIGRGMIVKRSEFMAFFSGKYADNTTGCFLSNSEIDTSDHSPTYHKFTMRLSEGVYGVHPSSIYERLVDLGSM